MPELALTIQWLTASFKVWVLKPLRKFQGCWASWPLWHQLGLLQLPLGRLYVRLDHSCIKALTLWKDPCWFQSGVDLGMDSRKKDRHFQHRLGSSVRGQSDFLHLAERGKNGFISIAWKSSKPSCQI